MTRNKEKKTYSSLAAYDRLLRLYPAHFLDEHRKEMLQNFDDLERTHASKTQLWFFIAKDLAVSVLEAHMKNLNTFPAYAIGVLWRGVFSSLSATSWPDLRRATLRFSSSAALCLA